MAKILQNYVKFSTKELQEFASNSDSCVLCVNSDMHLAMGPYGMANFKQALHELIIRTKVGIYDAHLNGIILGIKNIKVLSHTAALRADDPTMHLAINADFYVFRPEVGAMLSGNVRHISKKQISVIIYRVFNTTIRFTNKSSSRVHENISMDDVIKFRIKDFDIRITMPYIEGELLSEPENRQNGYLATNKSIRFNNEDEEIKTENAEMDPNCELSALVDLIKVELDAITPPKENGHNKRKKVTTELTNGSDLSSEKEIKKRKKHRTDLFSQEIKIKPEIG